MDQQLLKQYEKDLIFAIAMEANGIGKTTAGFIAEHFSDLRTFLEANAANLAGLHNASSEQVLSIKKIESVIERKSKVVLRPTVSETWICFLAQRFLTRQVELLKQLDFDSLDINPLLAKTLHLKNPKEIIEFNLYQTVTRSIVTAWGSTVEEMLKYSGCELGSTGVGSKGRRLDLKKVVSGRTYYLQIKSGPNTMNVDMIESLNEIIQDVEARGDHALLGMTYGRKHRVSAQILGNLIEPNKHAKIGRELWDFISEETAFHKKVISAIDAAIQEGSQFSFFEVMATKVNQFCKDWNVKYGSKNLDDCLEDYL